MDRLTALKVFVAVVEQGSLTAGAEQLDMSRAMASRYVAELESWMGTRLLHRTTRSLSLTGVGEDVLAQARAMLALGEEMEQMAIHPDSAPKGSLRVTCSYSFAEDFLMAAADEYLSQHTGVSVDVLVVDRAVNLVEERIDLAIRITNDLDPNLVARKLGTCRSVVCASPEYLAKHGTPRTLEELSSHNCLTYSYFGKSLWRFTGQDSQDAIPVGGNLSANISNLLLKNTLLGGGISLQPYYSVAHALKEGTLIPLLTDYEPNQLGIYGLYATRKQMSPLLRSFIDFLVEKMEKDTMWQKTGPA
ncbi:LysR family transcriptional regulator [Vibrio mangrovi]|uniref:HTH-type transcriptional regulator DmlR n=1 Tax=Vibrio mangrovi TaxID=474394 RepID=A0A1Y6IW82_9VIBR|nr:LysR family transcriptional regulator [Vibrio mangrovi]MDW6002532.1 LysR family transcriptional regulator [Vibrio mangrovi]SMS01935.1 HTH-type transcriptional regulator DmlR [Vibrio mangrovi]